MKLAEVLYLVAVLASVGGLVFAWNAAPVLPWVVVGVLGFTGAVTIHIFGWLGRRSRQDK